MKAIIINHNTKLVTSLALLSALRYADCPVTLIDCESTDGSFEYFRSLQQDHYFDLITMPLQPHGKTLDIIFAETTEDALLLIDSDLELLNSDIIRFMNEEIKKKDVYGAGLFLKGGIIQKHDQMSHVWLGMQYHPKPFTPIVAFKTDPVKEALKAGISFFGTFSHNEFLLLPKWLWPKRFYWGAKKIFAYRKKIYGHRAARVIYDTGAKMHDYLTRKGYKFSSMPYSETLYFTHYQSVTGLILQKDSVERNTKKEIIEKLVTERLKLYV